MGAVGGVKASVLVGFSAWEPVFEANPVVFKQNGLFRPFMKPDEPFIGSDRPSAAPGLAIVPAYHVQ